MKYIFLVFSLLFFCSSVFAQQYRTLKYKEAILALMPDTTGNQGNLLGCSKDSLAFFDTSLWDKDSSDDLQLGTTSSTALAGNSDLTLDDLSDNTTDDLQEGLINRYFSDSFLQGLRDTIQANIDTIGSNAVRISNIENTLDTLVVKQLSLDTKLETTGNNYDVVNADAGEFLQMGRDGTDVTITITTANNSSIPIGTQFHFQRASTGTVTFSPESGVVLNSADGAYALRSQYSAATLLKISETVWTLFGDIE